MTDVSVFYKELSKEDLEDIVQDHQVSIVSYDNVFHERDKLKQQNKELVKALQTTLSHCLLWQGEPDEFSCGVHAAVVKIAREALKNSEEYEN